MCSESTLARSESTCSETVLQRNDRKPKISMALSVEFILYLEARLARQWKKFYGFNAPVN